MNRSGNRRINTFSIGLTPASPIITVWKDVTASTDMVIPPPTSWVGGKQTTTTQCGQTSRAEVVYMTAQVEWGTSTSRRAGEPTEEGSFEALPPGRLAGCVEGFLVGTRPLLGLLVLGFFVLGRLVLGFFVLGRLVLGLLVLGRE